MCIYVWKTKHWTRAPIKSNLQSPGSPDKYAVSFPNRPQTRLHLSVVEARPLASKDISGVNDAFCTFYLRSRPAECFNTGCKVKAVNPKWNENFLLQARRTEDARAAAFPDENTLKSIPKI